MAKALIIKGANFADNKVRTITLSDPVDCTGITLNKSTASITNVGSTETLVATATPVDTTDTVVWTSSNDAIATVSNGVVTAHKVGTATITATCGNYSANCSVTIKQVADISTHINMYMSYHNSGFLQGGELTNYAIGCNSAGAKRIFNGESVGMYPIVIPDGATNIEISSPGLFVYGFWLSSTTSSSTSNAIAFAYPTDDFASRTTANSRNVTIPDRTTGTYEGMDAVGLVFRHNDNTVTEEMLSNIVVTFS